MRFHCVWIEWHFTRVPRFWIRMWVARGPCSPARHAPDSEFLNTPQRLNRGHLRFALDRPYIPGMDREFWQPKLIEAEAELDAARMRTTANAAAAKLLRAKAELKRLEIEQGRIEAAFYPWPDVGVAST
jgi:hypothetical protein